MTHSFDLGLRILLVDDQPMIRRLLGHLLGAQGHSVVLATRADQACSLLRASSFDLLISDIHLSEGCGLDLIRQIRETSDIPAIAMSADQGLEEPSLACGYSGFLAKPVSHRHLREEIGRLDLGSTIIRDEACLSR